MQENFHTSCTLESHSFEPRMSPSSFPSYITLRSLGFRKSLSNPVSTLKLLQNSLHSLLEIDQRVHVAELLEFFTNLAPLLVSSNCPSLKSIFEVTHTHVMIPHCSTTCVSATILLLNGGSDQLWTRRNSKINKCSPRNFDNFFESVHRFLGRPSLLAEFVRNHGVHSRILTGHRCDCMVCTLCIICSLRFRSRSHQSTNLYFAASSSLRQVDFAHIPPKFRLGGVSHPQSHSPPVGSQESLCIRPHRPQSQWQGGATGGVRREGGERGQKGLTHPSSLLSPSDKSWKTRVLTPFPLPSPCKREGFNILQLPPPPPSSGWKGGRVKKGGGGGREVGKGSKPLVERREVRGVQNRVLS